LLRFQQFYPSRITDTVNNISVSIYTILADAISQGALTGTALTTYVAGLEPYLSLLTGWDSVNLTLLIRPPQNFATLTLPADIKSVPILMRLHDRMVMLQQLGVSATDAIAWSKSFCY